MVSSIFLFLLPTHPCTNPVTTYYPTYYIPNYLPPTYLPTYRTYHLQVKLQRWNRTLTQLVAKLIIILPTDLSICRTFLFQDKVTKVKAYSLYYLSTGPTNLLFLPTYRTYLFRGQVTEVKPHIKLSGDSTYYPTHLLYLPFYSAGYYVETQHQP